MVDKFAGVDNVYLSSITYSNSAVWWEIHAVYFNTKLSVLYDLMRSNLLKRNGRRCDEP